jgi:hypothetical protein
MPKKVANSQNCTNFAVASSILVTENKKSKTTKREHNHKKLHLNKTAK